MTSHQVVTNSMNFRGFPRKILHSLLAPSSYPLLENLFSRLVGLTYLVAFGSLLPQISGLIGSHGVAPAAPLLSSMSGDWDKTRAFTLLPTLFWFRINDSLLLWCCWLGCAAAVLLTLSVLPRLAAAFCWILYLSLVSIGSPFTNFQWDALLLECGFLLLFAGSPWLVWAYRLLLFRLMFESGLVKFLSGDPTWRNLHALRFHFLTQPLPNPIAYYLFQAPTWLLDAFTGAALLIELVIPFLLFSTRNMRQAGVAALMLLQVVILLTGNYAFFNFLALSLCLWGLDDHSLLPLKNLLVRHGTSFHPSSSFVRSFRVAGCVLLSLLMCIGLAQIVQLLSPRFNMPFHSTLTAVAPFYLVNTYGLFAVMTTHRPEIVIEGSNDQASWAEYSFPYKPGNLHRGLPLIAPYQPRLDWQMWFAALGTYSENRWVGNLMYRLLTGDPITAKLLDLRPFSKPPRYMRALLYRYTFTSPTERSQTGTVWKRELQGTWFGPVSLTGQ